MANTYISAFWSAEYSPAFHTLCCQLSSNRSVFIQENRTIFCNFLNSSCMVFPLPSLPLTVPVCLSWPSCRAGPEPVSVPIVPATPGGSSKMAVPRSFAVQLIGILGYIHLVSLQDLMLCLSTRSPSCGYAWPQPCCRDGGPRATGIPSPCHRHPLPVPALPSARQHPALSPRRFHPSLSYLLNIL